eukprot:4088125-Prymnesium_polylepis.1
MAEGAIEGASHQYALKYPHSTAFLYSRYNRTLNDTCAPRNTKVLTGVKSQRNMDAPRNTKVLTGVKSQRNMDAIATST